MATPVDAGSIYSSVRIRLDKLTADIGAVKTGFDKLGNNLRTNSNKTQKTLTSNFDKIGLAGTAAIAGITLAFKQSLTVFAQTEQKLANVNAVSNATAEEFERLKTAAEEAGTTTRFTAGQAADALFFLSSAGLDATQSVEALDGVLTLAGATGSDLAQTAQAVTSTLSQFGLEASKSAEVSNVFAAANSNSQATLEKLQGALRQTGAVAGALDIPLEEVVGSLQALFNAGFQGENAGRALKSALADLANEASPTVKKLNELGISFNDVNPEVVGLTGAIGALEEANITTAQTIDAFGKVAGGQLVTLIKTGQRGLEEYTDAVTGTNEAARQYAIQNDTLAGSIDAFKSATEGAGNALNETLAPVLRTIIDAAASFLRLVVKIPKSIRALGAGAGSAALGFVALSKALALVGVSLSLGPLAIVAGIGAVVVGMSAFIKNSEKIKQQNLKEEFGELAEEIGNTGAAIDEFVKKAGEGEEFLARFFGVGIADQKELGILIRENAEAYGLTEKELIAIGLQSKEISKENKEILKLVREQVNEYTIMQGLSSTEELQREKLQRKEAERLKLIREYAKEQAEIAEKEQAQQDRKDRLAKIQERINSLTTLSNKGVLSELELLEEKKALREEEVQLLLTQAVESGDTSAQVISDINKQNAVIKKYQDRLDELNKKQEENKKKSEELAESEKNNYKEKLRLSQDFLDKGLFTESEALKEKAKIIQDEIELIKSKAKEDNKITDEQEANIKRLTGVLVGYQKEIKKASEELKNIEDPKLIDEIKLKIETQFDVILGDTIKELSSALSSGVSAATEKASNFNTLLEETMQLEEDRLTRIEEINQEIADNESLTAEEIKTLTEERNELLSNSYKEEINRLEDEKKQAELTGQALDYYKNQVEGLGQAALKYVEGDYFGAITTALTTLLQPALESLGNELQENLTPELIETFEKIQALSIGIGEDLAPAIIDLLELLAPFLELLTAILSLLAELVPFIVVVNKLNPALQALVFWANILTTALEGISGLFQLIADNTGAFGDTLQSIVDFIDGVTSLDFGKAGSAISNNPIIQGIGNIGSAIGGFLGFETGGIVPQQPGTSMTGDQQIIRANPRELVLTEEQQANLFSMIKSGGSSSGGSMVIQNILDGRIISESVVKYIDDGIVKLESR